MSVEIVHPVPDDRVDDMYRSAMKSYLEPAYDPALRGPWRRRALDPALCWAAVDAGRVVGTLRTIEDTLSVPGAPGGPTGAVDADLLSLVSVAATHRRRGLLRRMLDSSLTEAHDRGKPVSILVAAEWPIYGRFGYAPAVFEAHHEVDVRRRGAALSSAAVVGAVREIETDEASELAPSTYDAESAVRAGLIGRDTTWWDRELSRFGAGREVVDIPGEPAPRHVVHTGADGRVDGYLRWSVLTADDDGVGGALRVHDLFATSPGGHRELWRFLLGIDLVSRIQARHRPVDDPLAHLLVDGRAVSAIIGDAMWLRLLDVPAALSARGYAGEGELTIEVVDDAVGGWATGRFTLQADRTGAVCSPAAGRTADLTIPQSTLASAYLGGVRGAVLARAGGLDEHTPGAADRFDRLFATALAPWRATDF